MNKWEKVVIKNKIFNQQSQHESDSFLSKCTVKAQFEDTGSQTYFNIWAESNRGEGTVDYD